MKRNSLRTYSAAFAAVCTSSCHMECTDDMEHFFFKGVHICFLRTVKLIAVEYTFTTAACWTYITAGITADTFAELALEECKCSSGLIASDFLYFCKTICIFCVLGLADDLIIDHMFFSFAYVTSFQHCSLCKHCLLTVDCLNLVSVSAVYVICTQDAFCIPLIPVFFSISSFPLHPTPMM